MFRRKILSQRRDQGRKAIEPARAIGIVPQDTVLFHDTIRYNSLRRTSAPDDE